MPNIMYHFVGCDDNLKGISLEGFKAQLDFLQKTYSRDEIVATFDHGTIDHLETVSPELEKRGMEGMFFILTMVPEEHKVPSIDKQRYIEASLRVELAKMLCAALDINYNPERAKGYLQQFSFYSLEERYLRYLRDTIVPADDYNGFVGQYFQKVFGDEKDFASKNYLSWQHIVELHNRGHVIGSHSHYHYGDKDDYAKSIELIEGKIKDKVEYISYPNGIKRISDEDLQTLGIRKAYTSTENGADPYRVERIDCNRAHLIFGGMIGSATKRSGLTSV